nr:PIN domain-containing protein [Nguyenibacter vanlangensis]
MSDGVADADVVAWLSNIDATMLCLSAVTIVEIAFGVLRIERRAPDQGARLCRWMDQRILPEFADRILPVGTALALRCTPRPMPGSGPERAAFIAATALAHGMTIVTRNVAGFIPISILSSRWTYIVPIGASERPEPFSPHWIDMLGECLLHLSLSQGKTVTEHNFDACQSDERRAM